MYKVITIRNSFYNKAGDTVFAPNSGSLSDCLSGLMLILFGERTTIREAIEAGYRIVRA